MPRDDTPPEIQAYFNISEKYKEKSALKNKIFEMQCQLAESPKPQKLCFQNKISNLRYDILIHQAVLENMQGRIKKLESLLESASNLYDKLM